jgi:D-glycero-D-manno-heptose 1,7-bisphosphate phosphatase
VDKQAASPAMRRAVFLDRDGVLNEPIVRDGLPHSPRSLADFKIIQGTADALDALRQAGFLLIVATNQPEVVRGLQDRDVIEKMHAELRSVLRVDDVFTCYHDSGDRCACRKPEPGLILEAARKWEIRLDESYMIGDRFKDIEAGRRAGCRTILLAQSYNAGEANGCDYRAVTLADAASWILRRTGRDREMQKEETAEARVVTVMMPAYNAARYIGESVESLLAQSYANWELVVVNDGSTDETASVAAAYRDPRIRVLHQKNGGESSARNAALRNATGEYLAFLDADDLFLPEHLESAVKYLETHPECGGVYTDGIYIDAAGTHLKPLSSRRRGPFTGRIFEQMVRASDVFGTPACVVLRRAVIQSHMLEFDPDIVIGPDWDFLVQFSEHADFGYVDRPTCLYRVHTGNISNSTKGQERRRSLALCRQKAIKLGHFGECSHEVRAAVFYDLLVNLLSGDPGRQNEVIGWNEFHALQPGEQARLLRLMASAAMISGQPDGPIRDWLSKSARLNPSDMRSKLLLNLFRLNPGICRAVVKMKSRSRTGTGAEAPFADLIDTRAVS